MRIAAQQITKGRPFDRAAFCTTRQAAERIALSHRTVQMWAENGALIAPSGCARSVLIVDGDLHMPGLDGFGMIRTLRNNPATASLPLVVVSGMDKPAVLAPGLPADIAYLTKPAPLAALRAAVTSLLRAAS